MNSTLQSLLSRVVGRQKAAREQTLATYGEIIRAVADGREPEPELLEEVLARAGKSVDDLASAVELLVQRRAWKAEADALPAHSRKLEAVTAKATAAGEKLDAAIAAAHAAHQAAIAPLLAEEEIAKLGIERGNAAQAELKRTASADAKAKLAEIHRRRGVVTKEIETITRPPTSPNVDYRGHGATQPMDAESVAERAIAEVKARRFQTAFIRAEHRMQYEQAEARFIREKQEDLDRAEGRLKFLRDQRAANAARLIELNKQLDGIDAEIAAAEMEMLIP